MKKILAVFLLLVNLSATTVWANDDISFNNHETRVWTRTYPELYKPSSIILGKNNFFQIKAIPFSKVLFVSAFENFDIKDLFKNKDLNVQQKIVPASGLVQFDLSFENKFKELKGKELYFNAVVYEKSTPNKPQIVKIIDNNAQETGNKLVISAEPRFLHAPTLQPKLMGIEKVFKAVNMNKQAEKYE